MAKILDIIPYKILPAHMGGQKGIALFCKYLGQLTELTAVSVNDNDTSLAETYNLIPLFSKKRTRYLNALYALRIKKLSNKKISKMLSLNIHTWPGWVGFLKKV